MGVVDSLVTKCQRTDRSQESVRPVGKVHTVIDGIFSHDVQGKQTGEVGKKGREREMNETFHLWQVQR